MEVLFVDRLITEATLEAVLESRRRMEEEEEEDEDEERLREGKRGECRICHDEDLDSKMEAPCSCSGTLMYAHRRCVQRWCNEKGDTTCEICHQQFKPGFTAPPPLLQPPLNFRGISRQPVSDHDHFITVAAAPPEYHHYSVSSSRSFCSCRSLIITLMVLMVLRHTLPFLLTASHLHFFPMLTVMLARAAGVVVPIYLVSKAVAACHDDDDDDDDDEDDDNDADDDSSDEETVNPGASQLQPQSYIICIG